jgi:mono/diheme cytochrome c family protein
MRATALILSCVLTNALAVAADDPVDFNRDVRPILSDRCYGCHGPDADKGRKAGLRLDEFAGATKELKSGDRAIVPGDIEKPAL